MGRRIGRRIGAYSKSKVIPFRSEAYAYEKPLLGVKDGTYVRLMVMSEAKKGKRRECIYRAVFVTSGKYNLHMQWLPVKKMLSQAILGKTIHLIRDGEYYEVRSNMKFKILTEEEAMLETL